MLLLLVLLVLGSKLPPLLLRVSPQLLMFLVHGRRLHVLLLHPLQPLPVHLLQLLSCLLLPVLLSLLLVVQLSYAPLPGPWLLLTLRLLIAA
jgi:hypothetical protein